MLLCHHAGNASPKGVLKYAFQHTCSMYLYRGSCFVIDSIFRYKPQEKGVGAISLRVQILSYGVTMNLVHDRSSVKVIKMGRKG